MAPSTSTTRPAVHFVAVSVLAVLLCAGVASAKGGGGSRPDLRIMVEDGQRDAAAAPEFTVTKKPDEGSVTPVPSVLALNSYTFGGNVLGESQTRHVAHWVVIFCPSWWEPCQNIEKPFEGLAKAWQGRLNQDLLSSEVRFAAVDCATDKVLCNEQDVDGYPTVSHYAGGVRVGKWSGGQKDDIERLPKWISKQFAAASAAAGAAAAGATGAAKGLPEVLAAYLVPGERAADILLALVALAASFRLVLSNPELAAKGGFGASSAAAARAGEEAATTGSAAARLRRALPQEWSAARSSVEL